MLFFATQKRGSGHYFASVLSGINWSVFGAVLEGTTFHPVFGYMPKKPRQPRVILFLYPHMFLKMYIYFIVTSHYKLNTSFTMFLMEILGFDAGLARLNV